MVEERGLFPHALSPPLRTAPTPLGLLLLNEQVDGVALALVGLRAMKGHMEVGEGCSTIADV